MKRNKQYKLKQKLRSYISTMKRNRSNAMFEWLKKLYVANLYNDVEGFVRNHAEQ